MITDRGGGGGEKDRRRIKLEGAVWLSKQGLNIRFKGGSESNLGRGFWQKEISEVPTKGAGGAPRVRGTRKGR